MLVGVGSGALSVGDGLGLLGGLLVTGPGSGAGDVSVGVGDGCGVLRKMTILLCVGVGDGGATVGTTVEVLVGVGHGEPVGVGDTLGVGVAVGVTVGTGVLVVVEVGVVGLSEGEGVASGVCGLSVATGESVGVGVTETFVTQMTM